METYNMRENTWINEEEVDFLVVDKYAGAGGTSEGFEEAENAIVIAAINHDEKAIESHWLNHPNVEHFNEDITRMYGKVIHGYLFKSPEMIRLERLLDIYRAFYPNAKVIMWSSLECTNFSKAKGGQPREADSRSLAEHEDRYIAALDPDYIQIENVVEFMSWGPLDEMGKPVSRRNGRDWMKWRLYINSLGYRDEWKEMNSADFGAYTSRNRLFGCFAKNDLPIVWPKPTHSKKAGKPDLFGGGLKKWKAVKEVLDFEDEGVSIFKRKKNLSSKTLERIYAGLIKYVAGGKDAFLVRWNSVSSNGSFKQTATTIENPCPTVTVQNRLGLAFIQKHFSGKPDGKVIPVSGPTGALTTVCNQSLVQPIFMVNYNHSSQCNNINQCCPTLLTRDKLGLVSTCFLSKYYGTSDNCQSVDEPAGTITTKDRFAKYHVVWLDKTYTGANNHQCIEQPAGSVLSNDKHQKVHAIWLDRNFTGGGQHSSIEKPAGSVMPVPKMNLVNAKPFIMNTNYGNIGKSIDEPAPPLLASKRHHYIVNPSHGGHSTSVENPCPVIVARQDKAPLYLTSCTHGETLIFDAPNFFDKKDWEFLMDGYGEPSIRVKIIEFMFLYNISDIKMRMLKVSELLPIQGFPRNYVLKGNQSDQKKFIGNSVVPLVVKHWSMELGRAIKVLREAA